MTAKNPWTFKQQNKMDDVHLVLEACIETLRVDRIMIQTIVPSLSSKLLYRLNVAACKRKWNRAVFTKQEEK